MNRYGDTAQLCYRVDGRGLNFPVSCVCVCVCVMPVYCIRHPRHHSGVWHVTNSGHSNCTEVRFCARTA